MSDTALNQASASQDVWLPWHRAATIAERADGNPGEIDHERAAKRLSQWRRLPALAAVDNGSASDLDPALAPFGVTGTRLEALLGETDESLRERLGTEPTWHQRFRELWELGLHTDVLSRDANLELLELARPLLAGAAHDLRHRGQQMLDEHPHEAHRAVGAVALHHLVAAPPVIEMSMTVGPTMVLELNVARVEGHLTADTSEGRYEQFVESLRDPARSLELFREYTVLARFLVTRLGYWVDRNLEFLRRLLDNLPELERTFFDGQTPDLVRVEFGAGDSHRRGRSVAIVEFEQGKVVCKPRSPELDLAFDGLLAWFNAQGPTHELRRPGLIARDDHAWFEFIDSSEATDDAGADRFAHRLGALLALSYCLHSTDFHFENVLAAGEHPILIDLEALLHVEKSDAMTDFSTKLQGPAAEVLGDSVISVGILPNRVLATDEGKSFAVDVSAVAGTGGQMGIVRVPTFVDIGKDTMHIAYEFGQVEDQQNLPTGGDGEAFALLDRREPFRQGFTEAYELLLRGHDELLGPDGLLSAFGQTAVRHIARPTFLYGRLSLQSMHPDFLRDELDHSMCLGKLLGGHPQVEERDAMISAEYRDMLDGDVPVFMIRASDGQVLAGSDEVPIGERPAPLEGVSRRVNELSEADLDFQSRLIDYSFAAASIDGQIHTWPGWTAARPPEGIEAEDLVEATREVGQALVDTAVWAEGEVGWIGLDLVDDRWWTLGPASIGLYTGIPGIALALTAAAQVTGESAFDRVAEQAMDQVCRAALGVTEFMRGQQPGPKMAPADCGAFGLMGGTMYALSQAGVRYQREDWLQAAESLVRPLAVACEMDNTHDIVAGRAGAIHSLLALHQATISQEALDLAEECGRGLVRDRARRGDQGAAWLSPLADDTGLVGFSHGAAGIAVALARLHALRPDPVWPQVIEEALAYERQHLNEQTGDWADLREEAVNNPYGMRAWCHGAPGAALARQALLDSGVPLSDRSAVERERDLSLRAIADTGLGGSEIVTGIGNHSICHGDIGNLLCLELAAQGSQEFDDAMLRTSWAALVEAGRRDGWWCGVPGGLHTPGLMTGLAGIVWGLAFRAAAFGLPNVLLLEPPLDGLGEVL